MSASPKTWSQSEVQTWLGKNSMSSLKKTFKNYNVDGESLLQLDENILLIWGVGGSDRRKVLKKIEELKNPPVPQGGLVSTLMNMFPHLPQSTIQHAAQTNQYDFQQCAKMLETMAIPNESPDKKYKRISRATLSSTSTDLREHYQRRRRSTVHFKPSVDSQEGDSKYGFVLSDVSKSNLDIFEEFCELFPDQDPEIVDTAMTLAKGDYDETLDQLLSLNPSPNSVIEYENVILQSEQQDSPYMSVTRSGFNDEDLFDNAPLSRQASVMSPDDEGEEEEKYSMIQKLLDFLEDVNGTGVRRKTMYFPVELKDKGEKEGEEEEEKEEVVVNYDEPPNEPPPVRRDVKPNLDSNEATGQHNKNDFRHESRLLDANITNILQKNRWAYRPDVVSSGVLEKMSKEEVRRQEALAEIVTSEQAYQSDLNTLIDLIIIPLNKLFTVSGEMKSAETRTGTIRPQDFTAGVVANMKTWVVSLQNVGKQLYSALLQRQRQNIKVDSMSDILIQFAPKLRRVFVSYCSVCFHLQRATESQDEPVRELLENAGKDPRAKSLPINAFLLAPIQRLARYPLLVKAVVGHTPVGHPDYEDLLDAVELLESAVDACNGRLRLLEDRQQNERLDAKMDYSRLENNVPLSLGARSLVKRSPLVFLRVHKGKVTGSKKIYCFLFTDLFMYAKHVKGKGTYVVYKQIHRSLVGVSEVDKKLIKKKSKGFFFEITIYGPDPIRLLVDAKTKKLKDEWMETLSTKHTSGSAYEEWDCPRFLATKNYSPKKKDEIELRKGDTIDVLIRNSGGRAKGRLMRNTDFGMLAPVAEGWFPLSVVKEVDSTHAQAKKFKEQFDKESSNFTSSHK